MRRSTRAKVRHEQRVRRVRCPCGRGWLEARAFIDLDGALSAIILGGRPVNEPRNRVAAIIRSGAAVEVVLPHVDGLRERDVNERLPVVGGPTVAVRIEFCVCPTT